ncbi:MAG: shikimate kinase [Actinomycetota bacterium]
MSDSTVGASVAATGKAMVVVTGPMGAGKSTVATAVADALGVPHRDSDHDLEALTGKPGVQLAAEHDVAVLHRLEAAVLLGALADDRPTVVSAAASVVEDEWCRMALAARATTVVLTAPVDELLRRAATGEHRRPMTAEELTALMARRQPLFDAVADLTIDARQPADEVAEAVLAHLRRR